MYSVGGLELKERQTGHEYRSALPLPVSVTYQTTRRTWGTHGPFPDRDLMYSNDSSVLPHRKTMAQSLGSIARLQGKN